MHPTNSSRGTDHPPRTRALLRRNHRFPAVQGSPTSRRPSLLLEPLALTRDSYHPPGTPSSDFWTNWFGRGYGFAGVAATGPPAHLLRAPGRLLGGDGRARR